MDRDRQTREEWDDPSGNTFEWSEPTRADAFGARPRFSQEVTIAEVKGTYNNCDVYVAADTTWTSPFLGGVRLNLYALVGNSAHPIQVGVDPATLPGFVVVGTQWKVYALSARGRVCDGFRVTVTKGPPLISPPPDPIHDGQVTIYAWGHETAAADQVTVTLAPGQAVNATIVAPLPLPTSEAPASDWSARQGTAPDGSSGGLAAALAAGAVQRYVDLTSSLANPSGSIIYVSRTAVSIAAGPTAYELGPGDTVTMAVANANEIFINGSQAGLVYKAAVT